MKITMEDGKVSIDTKDASVDEILAVIRGLNDDTAVAKPQAKGTVERRSSPNDSSTETLSLLRTLDTAGEGVYVEKLAHELGLQDTAARSRLQRLRAKGKVTQLASGAWRAV